MLSIKKFYQEFKFVFWLFVFWRVALFLLGLPGFHFLTFKASFPNIDELLISSGYPQWLWQWGNFDGVHYLDIASHGYHGSGLQVFFPIYPLLIKLLTIFIHNYFLSGLLLSNLAIFLAAVALFRLVKREFDQKTASWSVAFLFAFPTSFFFGSLYTESLFLLFLLLAFSQSGVSKGIFGALASGTRLIGVFLVPIVSLAGLGIVGYMIYLQIVFHNPLYFLSAQAAFRNARSSTLTSLVTPPQVVFRYLKIFTTADHTHPDFWVALLELGSFLFAIALLSWLTIKKKVPLPWLIFSWPSLLLPTLSGTLSSMPRYLLTIFPIFVGLALIKNQFVKFGILVVLTLLLAWLTVFFTRGYFIG